MPSQFKKLAQTRILILGIVALLWSFVILVRLFDLQVVRHGEMMDKALRQQQHIVNIVPHRGVIYDRQHRELAISVDVDSLAAWGSQIKDPKSVAHSLARLLHMETSEIESKLNSTRGFVWIKRKLEKPEADAVRALNLKGLEFIKESSRSPGDDTILTIDENIQYITQKALDAAMEATHSEGGTAIVMNPRTGEILSLANSPDFNPNSYKATNPDTWKNRAVQSIYEPGSTFKIITVAAALEEGLTTPEEVIDCQMGAIVLAGHTIHDHERQALARLGDHGGADRGVGALVDQDEAARGAVPGVGVAEDGLGEAEPDPADLVQAQLDRGLVAVQGVHVDPVVQVGADRLHRARGVLDGEPAAPRQHLLR